MNSDFHYYATYCAAILAGWSHEDSMTISYCDQFVDLCTKTLLLRLHAPLSAATTQLSMEMLNAPTDPIGLQDITRIWASFHFLPYDLYADVRKGSKKYKDKYRLICNSNGDLVIDTVNLAKDRSMQAVGIAMHVLADTWAHKYFAGTPSQVINNTNYHFYEVVQTKDGCSEKKLRFSHSPSTPDDLMTETYNSSISRNNENSIMNLGHGRAGHLPDYSFMRYKYLPAWGAYEEVLKDNPSDYYFAFSQMVQALKYLNGRIPVFEKNTYDTESVSEYEDRIRGIIEKHQLDSSADWKAFGEELSGCTIEPFDLERYQQEYLSANENDKDETFLGRFFIAAMAQKSMVTNKIYTSGNLLAGYSVDYKKSGFKGIRDYIKLVLARRKEG